MSPAPILEFDMLVAMKEFMLKLLKEHTTEINALVKIKQDLKKATTGTTVNPIVQLKQIEDRIKYLNGIKNQEHNFISFLKDYLKKLKG